MLTCRFHAEHMRHLNTTPAERPPVQFVDDDDELLYIMQRYRFAYRNALRHKVTSVNLTTSTTRLLVSQPPYWAKLLSSGTRACNWDFQCALRLAYLAQRD